MTKQIESSLGERMQGSGRIEPSLALGILKGRYTLEEIKDKIKFHVDWAFVAKYISDHKHEYPDYKE